MENGELSWKERGLVALVLTSFLAGSLGLASIDAPASKPKSERKPVKEQKAPQQTNEVPKKVKSEFHYLDKHDQLIANSINYFRGIHNVEPPKHMVKSIMAIEAANTKALDYDPMQISNEGDHALNVLANKREYSWLIGDFSCLQDNKPTQRVNGKWDYEHNNMTPAESILGGVGWLYHKAAIYESKTFESGEVQTYYINRGDSFDRIARKLNTTPQTLIKYNPGVDPRRLQVGQRVKFKQAVEKMTISGWKPWTNAVEAYNGGGDPQYLNKVLTVKEKLDKGK